MKMIYDNEKHNENVLGDFWVNDQCIDCGLCYEVAPKTFRIASDGSQSIVYQQPTTDKEIADAQEALECCPVEAIERL